MSAFGFDWALVRHQNLSADYLNTGWTLRALIGVATFAVLSLLAPLAAAFYRVPALTAVLPVLGVASFIGSLENIGMVYFRRDFAFHKEFLVRTASKLSSLVVTVSLAVAYRSYWALVAGAVALRAGGTVASYLLHPYRPRATLVHARELLGFSSWLLAASIVDYFRDKFSNVYLGRVFGPRGTGLFALAGELSQLPLSAVAAPINRVAYSKYSEEVRASRPLGASYLEIASMIWLISLPMCAGTIATASEIVRLFLGPQWEDAAAVLRWLALGTAFNVLVANTHCVYLALGHARILAALNALGAAIIVPMTIVMSHLAGFLGVAIAYALTAGVLVPVNFAWLRRRAGIRFGSLWPRVWRVTLASSVMLVVLDLAVPRAGSETAAAAALTLLVKVASGAALYATALAAMWLASGRPEGPERQALRLVLRWSKRLVRQDARS
jgi:O-antigen/teichoic acid export membrane protein